MDDNKTFVGLNVDPGTGSIVFCTPDGQKNSLEALSAAMIGIFKKLIGYGAQSLDDAVKLCDNFPDRYGDGIWLVERNRQGIPMLARIMEASDWRNSIIAGWKTTQLENLPLIGTLALVYSDELSIPQVARFLRPSQSGGEWRVLGCENPIQVDITHYHEIQDLPNSNHYADLCSRPISRER